MRRRIASYGRGTLGLLWAIVLGLSAGVAQSAEVPWRDRQFTWMYGLQGAAGLDTARQLGLNTVYLRTTTLVDSVEENRRTAQAAERLGLQVIVALPTLSEARAADPDDPEYVAEVGARIRTIVRQFLRESAVTAWAVSDYAEQAVHYTPAGFQAFLQKRYGTLDLVNAAWGSQFPTWASITLTSARQADVLQPNQVGRASVDLADYQADALERLLALWAREVRALDPRPLFTGRLCLYRSLVSVPEDYAFIVTEAPVDLLEPDYLSQNVQAVDIARQGGAREVIAGVRVPVPPAPYYAAGATVGRWLREAALHGARGVALDGAERIAQCASPADVLTKLAAHLRPLEGAFQARPQNSLAVLYEPYAEGLAAGGIPAYGYLAGLATGQPSLLVQAFRLGTRFGLVDYLTPERMVGADLENYSAILAPTALRMPVELQARLRLYVQRGGRLVCDLGAGMYETGSWQSLPPELAGLCGVASFGALQTKSSDLTLSPPTALLPSLRPPLRSRGLPKPKTTSTTSTVERSTFTGTPQEARGVTIQGLVGYVSLTPEAEPLALVDAQVPTLPMPPGRLSAAAAAALKRQLRAGTRFAGVVGQPHGLGWGVYSSATLWSNWDPTDPFFQGFHGDLWAPRARWVVRQPVPGVEMSAEPGALHLLNTGSQSVLAEVQMLPADVRLYLSGFAQVAPPPARGAPAAPLLLTAELAGEEFRTLREAPVRVIPYAATVAAYLSRYGEEEVRLEIAGPGATLTFDAHKQRTFTRGAAATVRVVLEDGPYRLLPGSAHRLQSNNLFNQETTETVRADEAGQLSFEVTGGRVLLRLTPLADG